MYLSNKIYHINAGISNQYLFMFSIVREFDQFLVLLELFKLRVQDDPSIQIVVDHCTKYPNRRSILNKVDNQLQDSLKLDYYQVENYLPELKNKVDYVNANYQENDNRLINFPINNQFKVIFSRIQINRLYNDMESYYKNYLILETLFQLTLSTTESEKKEVVSIEKERNNLKNKYYQENNIEQNTEQDFQQTVAYEETKFDNIFELCINSILKSFLLHITVNYYFCINENMCKFEYNEQQKIFHLPSLFPLTYIFNTKYFKSLVLTLNTYTIENIKLRCDKILRKLQEDEITPLEIMMLNCLLFLYYIRFLSESHTDYLSNNIVKIFNDTDLQSRLLDNHTKTYFPNFNIKFKIQNIHIDDIQEDNIDVDIEEISKKHSHLISVSEQDFVDKVLIDLDKKEDVQDGLLFNSKKIFNIESFKNQKSAAVNNKLQNPEFNNVDKKDELLEYNLIKYDFNNDYLTEANSLLSQYIQDKNTFLIRLKTNEIKSNVPNTIINLFEVIMNILYDKELKIQDYYNTYDYYRILCNNLNDSSIFPHVILLYIIYQIIIPYLYLNHNIKEFEDIF